MGPQSRRQDPGVHWWGVEIFVYRFCAEPCTVPQNLTLSAVSSGTATISWTSPVKNKGHPEVQTLLFPKRRMPQLYTLYFAQEPCPEFRYWSKYRLGARTKFTLTDLMADTDYWCEMVPGIEITIFPSVSASRPITTAGWPPCPKRSSCTRSSTGATTIETQFPR